MLPASGGTAMIEAEFEEIATVRSGQTAQLRTSYVSAQRDIIPRKLPEVMRRVEIEAELASEDFYYAWTQKGGVIEGTSIDGAMILVRNFGNCVAEAQVIQEGASFWVFDAVFMDLETGFTTSRQFRQRKTQASQKVGKDNDADRLLDIAFQIGQSKAIRNVVVKAMPGWLIGAAMKKAKAAADGQYKNIPEWVDKTIVAYAEWKVTQAELERKVGRPSNAWASSDIRLFTALHRAIKARETSIEAEFRTVEGEVDSISWFSPVVWIVVRFGNPQPTAIIKAKSNRLLYIRFASEQRNIESCGYDHFRSRLFWRQRSVNHSVVRRFSGSVCHAQVGCYDNDHRQP